MNIAAAAIPGPLEHDALAQVRRWFDNAEAALKALAFYDSYPLNEFWKKHNTPEMLRILRTARNDAEALAAIQGTYFFVVQLQGAAAGKALEWQWARLERENPSLLAMIERIGESSWVPDSLTLPYKGSRYSVDIFRVATIADNIFGAAALDKAATPVFFELGAGLGHLARFIKERAPGCKYIISDLPISLCFSYLFLRHNFPDARLALLDVGETITPELLEQADFVLAPPSILTGDIRVKTDVFINTCSLGEMENGVSVRWLAYVQDVLKPKYLYSLNRFLNHIDNSPDYAWRAQENSHLAAVGAAWEVLAFNLEDERFFSPYLACIHPRYLELILRCAGEGSAPEIDMNRLADGLLAHASISLYANHGWSVNYYGAKLTQDLSSDGELFRYWNAARLNPCPLSYLLLLLYLDRMNLHSRMPFEETRFLEARLARWAAAAREAAVRDKLTAYLARRSAVAAGRDTSPVERHQPGEIVALVHLLNPK